MAVSPVANLLEILNQIERSALTFSSPTSSKAAAKDAGNRLLTDILQLVDYFGITKPEQLLDHLNKASKQQSGSTFQYPLLNKTDIPKPSSPPNPDAIDDPNDPGNLRLKFVLLDKWIQMRHDVGSETSSTPLLELSQTILKTSRLDLGESGERAKKAAEFLELCINANEKILSPDAIISYGRWQKQEKQGQTEPERVTAATLESASNTITQTFRHLSAGGTEANRQYLDKIAKESVEYLLKFAEEMNPENSKSLMASMLGSKGGQIKSLLASPNSVFHNLTNLDPHVGSAEGAYHKGSVIGTITEFVKKDVWGWVNNAFGFNPNAGLLNRADQYARSVDPQYQMLQRSLKKGMTAVDKFHRNISGHAGRITAQVTGKADRSFHLELVTRIAELIQKDERFAGMHFDLQGCLKRVRGSFVTPGYEAYLPLHLAHSLHVRKLEGIMTKLLPVFDPRQADSICQEYMIENGPDGTPIFRSPSLYGIFSIFSRAFSHKLAETEHGLLGMSYNFPNEERAAKHTAQTNVRNRITDGAWYLASKVSMIREQFERALAYKEFSLARMNGHLRMFFNKAVPALNFLSYNVFSTWGLVKKIPFLGWPLHLIEGVHGLIGGALSLVGSGFGLIPPAKKAIDKMWSFTSPLKLRDMATHSVGNFYQVNACVGLLRSTVTPYWDALGAIEKILAGTDIDKIDASALKANLRNVYIFLDSYVMNMAKAARCGVGLSPRVAERFGIPVKMITIQENGAERTVPDPQQYVHPAKLIWHFRSKMEEFYKKTYASSGEEPFQVKHTLVSQRNQRRLDHQPFGQELEIYNQKKKKFELSYSYSDTYDGFDDNGSYVQIFSDASEEQKARARLLNERDHRAQIDNDDRDAQSSNDKLRERLSGVNSDYNAMRNRLKVMGMTLEQAVRDNVNTTEVCPGYVSRAAIRDTPENVIGSHKYAQDSHDPSLDIGEEQHLDAGNKKVVFRRVNRGPSPRQPYSDYRASRPLVVTLPPGDPAMEAFVDTSISMSH